MEKEKIYSQIKSHKWWIGILISLGALMNFAETVLKVIFWGAGKMTPDILDISIVVIVFSCLILFSFMEYRDRWVKRLRAKEDANTKLEEKIKQYDELVKECKKEEEVSKEHFDKFKAITLSFEDLFNTNKNPLVKLFNELYAKTPELLSYNNRLKDYISRSYNNCIKRLKKFGGTKECFELLVNEFENVFFAYEDLFVKPIEKRKDEIAMDKNLKRKFNEFADEYGAMRRQYIDYGKEMNKMYGTNIIRTDFDYVDKI